jgi:hypothetical protein
MQIKLVSKGERRASACTNLQNRSVLVCVGGQDSPDWLCATVGKQDESRRQSGYDVLIRDDLVFADNESRALSDLVVTCGTDNEDYRRTRLSKDVGWSQCRLVLGGANVSSKCPNE